jgi:dihydroorotase-like cyclic amidohydrolase
MLDDCAYPQSALILVENEKIVDVVKLQEIDADTLSTIEKQWDDIRDYGDLYIFPGVVDSNIHLSTGLGEDWDDINISTSMAAKGGVTTVVDNCFLPKPFDTAEEHLSNLKEKAAMLAETSKVDFGLVGLMEPRTIDHIQEFINFGVLGFKTYLIKPFQNSIDSLSIEQFQFVLDKLSKLTNTTTLAVHPEYADKRDIYTSSPFRSSVNTQRLDMSVEVKTQNIGDGASKGNYISLQNIDKKRMPSDPKKIFSLNEIDSPTKLERQINKITKKNEIVALSRRELCSYEGENLDQHVDEYLPDSDLEIQPEEEVQLPQQQQQTQAPAPIVIKPTKITRKFNVIHEHAKDFEDSPYAKSIPTPTEPMAVGTGLATKSSFSRNKKLVGTVSHNLRLMDPMIKHLEITKEESSSSIPAGGSNTDIQHITTATIATSTTTTTTTTNNTTSTTAFTTPTKSDEVKIKDFSNVVSSIIATTPDEHNKENFHTSPRVNNLPSLNLSFTREANKNFFTPNIKLRGGLNLNGGSKFPEITPCSSEKEQKLRGSGYMGTPSMDGDLSTAGSLDSNQKRLDKEEVLTSAREKPSLDTSFCQSLNIQQVYMTAPVIKDNSSEISPLYSSEIKGSLSYLTQSPCTPDTDMGTPLSSRLLFRRVNSLKVGPQMYSSSPAEEIFSKLGLVQTKTVDAKAREKESKMNKSYTVFLANRPLCWEQNGVNLVLNKINTNKVKILLSNLSLCTSVLQICKFRKYNPDYSGNVFSDVSAAHLYFNDKMIRPSETKYKASPPVRDRDNKKMLLEEIKLNAIDCVSSYHTRAPDAYKSVDNGNFRRAFNGFNSSGYTLQTLWTLLYLKEHKSQAVYECDKTNKKKVMNEMLGKLNNLLCKNPSQIYNLDKVKGSIKVGKHADFVVWDPEQTIEVKDQEILYDNAGSHLFHNRNLLGLVHKTYLRGKIIYDKDDSSVLKMSSVCGKQLTPNSN